VIYVGMPSVAESEAKEEYAQTCTHLGR
jgi:hypothetical protein